MSEITFYTENSRITANLGKKRLTIFINLFIYDKGPESATDMPMTVNSKLTHYKIRQIKYCPDTGNGVDLT